MKSVKIKRIFSLFAALSILFLAVFSLSSCVSDVNKEHAETMTRDLIDCLIEDDFMSAYKFFRNNMTKENFRVGYNEIIDYFVGIKNYELEQIGWHVYNNNGVSMYSVTFKMTGNVKQPLMIESIFLKETDEFASFRIDLYSKQQKSGNIILSIMPILISVLIFGFTVWAFIDCIIRKIKLKALWLIIIFIGFSITMTFGESLGLHFSLALIFPLSKFVTDGYNISITAAIPVGSIVYLIICRFLPKKLPPVQNAVEIKQDDVVNTVNPSENAVIETDNAVSVQVEDKTSENSGKETEN